MTVFKDFYWQHWNYTLTDLDMDLSVQDKVNKTVDESLGNEVGRKSTAATPQGWEGYRPG